MNDPIERQIAIDAVQGIKRLATLPDNDAVVRMSAVEHVLFNLPSAQSDLQQTCNKLATDTIYRQAAIDALEERLRANGYGNVALVSELNRSIGYIMQLPSAQPEQQWIPCSERMPEDLEEVNVTWANHDPEPYYDFTKDKPATASAVYYKGKWYWYSSVCTDLLAEYGENEVDKMDDAIEVIAWMPLPEPWRGEEHETTL